MEDDQLSKRFVDGLSILSTRPGDEAAAQNQKSCSKLIVGLIETFKLEDMSAATAFSLMSTMTERLVGFIFVRLCWLGGSLSGIN